MDLSERGSATGRHPWEIERFRAYRRVLTDHGALPAKRILDVGAGDGWFGETLIADLPDVAELVCWDINYDDPELTTGDARIARTRVAPAGGFDLVLLLDVLEHIDDPTGFVAEQLVPLADPGTPVLVAVPAHPRLYGNHDRALGHHRRYSIGQLLDQIDDWVDVVDHGPLFTALVPVRTVAVAVERMRPGGSVAPVTPGRHGVGRWRHGPAVSRLVRAPLAADTALTRRLGPLRRRITGLSHWAYGYAR